METIDRTTQIQNELAAAEAESRLVPGNPMERTGDQWRLLARLSGLRDAESFERCDTDGFLSQWASQQMRNRYLDMASYADNGHVGQRLALFDLDGNVLTLRDGQNDWGNRYWIVDGENGRTFLNESNAMKLATARRNNEKKGFRLGFVTVKVELTVHDSILTDEVVGTETADWYGDMIESGMTTILD